MPNNIPVGAMPAPSTGAELGKQPKAIPRVPFDSASLFTDYIERGQPVVVTGAPLVQHLAQTWNPDYLAEHAAHDALWTVYSSPSKDFRYWSKDKHFTAACGPFVPPTQRLDMTMKDAVARLKARKERLQKAEAKGVETGERFYLQETLTVAVGERLKEDFQHVKWEWISQLQKKGGWGPLTNNVLLVGSCGNTTPSHYDEQENILSQIHGKKAVTMHPPDAFDGMYPFPLSHAHDRQSQVDINNPDSVRFPLHASLAQPHAMLTVLEPGELLYIPAYWWHHIRSVSDNYDAKQHLPQYDSSSSQLASSMNADDSGDITVSLTFWFKCAPTDVENLKLPIRGPQRSALTRNLERFISSSVKPDMIKDAFYWLAHPEEVAACTDDALKQQRQTFAAGVGKLMSHVLAEEDQLPFLKMLWRGRYELIVKEQS